MGAGNAKLAFARWGHLAHTPFRLLVYMAVIALDEDPRYWGGRDGLCIGLGATPEELADPALARAAGKKVDRALAVLRKEGVVELTRPAAPRRNAEYSLHLTARPERSTLSGDHSERPQSVDGLWIPGSGDDDGRSNGPRSAGSTVPAERGQRSPLSGVRRPADTSSGSDRSQVLLEEDYGADLRTPVTAARASNDPPENPRSLRAINGTRPRPVNGHRPSQPATVQPGLWPVALRRAQ